MGRKNRRHRDSAPVKSEITWHHMDEAESDFPDENPPQTEAVRVILEALEGLWYDSPYNHPDQKDQYSWENAVNGYVQALKQEIQRMLP